MAGNGIEESYRAKTGKSAEWMERGGRSLPGGVTRNFGYHRPYPVVMDRGQGRFSGMWMATGTST